jgi:hypothetical protein
MSVLIRTPSCDNAVGRAEAGLVEREVTAIRIPIVPLAQAERRRDAGTQAAGAARRSSLPEDVLPRAERGLGDGCLDRIAHSGGF